MLAQSTPTSYSTGLQGTERIQSLNDFLTYLQSDVPAFPSPEEHSQNGGEREHQQNGHEINGEHAPEFTYLGPHKDFGEMLSLFLVSGHEKIFRVQSEIRVQRTVHNYPLLAVKAVNEDEFQAIRTQLYRNQNNYLYYSKGNECDLFF